MMKFFSKKELKIISSILLIIFTISFFNFRVSIRRARDNQRKNDLGTLQQALNDYINDLGSVPLSTQDGKIIACKGEDTYFDEELDTWFNIKPCEWGEDSLENFKDISNKVYMSPLPTDPQNLQGLSFIYLSNGKRFQLLAYLEGEDEAEYNFAIEQRGISCGTEICNYGRSYGGAPLDKSLEEYENELSEKQSSN